MKPEYREDNPQQALKALQRLFRARANTAMHWLWHTPRFWTYLLSIFVVLCVWWYFHPPIPGYAITAMAVAATIMALRTDLTPLEKSLWLLVIIAFGIVEIGAINHDRKEYANQVSADRERQNENFGQIANGLKDSIRRSEDQFRATMSSMQAIIESSSIISRRSQLAVHSITGGDSFSYVALNESKDGLVIVNRGEYPLTALLVLVTDAPHIPNREFNFQVLTPHLIKHLFQHNFSDVQEHDLYIVSNAVNGSWLETLQIRSVGRRLFSALRVIQVKLKSSTPDKLDSVELQEIWCKVEEGYPLINDKVEWNENMDYKGKPFKLPSVPCPRH